MRWLTQHVLLGKKFPLHGDIPKEKDLFRSTLDMAWPSMVESLMTNMAGIVDTIMVGGLGAYAISAVGLTSQPKFLCLCVFLSLNASVSALVARRKGEGDRVAANRIFRQAFHIAAILAVLFSILCIAFATPFLSLAGANGETLPYAAGYFRIVMGGMSFQVITMVINAAQRGAGNTKVTMRTNVVSTLVNIFFNYLLIEGHWGFPALGVNGSAVATVLGTVAACAMSLYSVIDRRSYIRLQGVFKPSFDRATMGTINHLTSATLGDQLFLRIGFFIFAKIVATLGTAEFAAHQIGMNLLGLSFAFGDGLGVASLALVGQSLGAKRPDLARIYCNICLLFGMVAATVISFSYTVFGRLILSVFTREPRLIDMAMQLRAIIAFILFLQITHVILSGCLRGAGDVKFIALVSLISVAIVRPFCGWLFCVPMGWGLIGAWIGLSLDQVCRSSMTVLRFRSGKWMDIKI